MQLKLKLIVIFLAIGFFPLTVIGVISYIGSKNALINQTTEQIIGIRDARKAQLQNFFRQNENNLKTLSKSKMTVLATREFIKNFHKLGEDSVRNLYIFNNPNPVGEKLNLDYATDGSNYSKTHKLYHQVFRDYLDTFGYYDIFIVDPETGHIVYTVFKEDDFGTSLTDGKYNNTNIASNYISANESAVPDYTAITDMEPYEPSSGAPAAFISTPVFDGSKKIGVLIFQINISQINKVMMEKSGLGETGETYLVGTDYLMRSNSRFAKNEESFVLKTKVESETVKKALAGTTGVKQVNDYRNVPVLSAYSPAEIQGLDWAIMGEMDKQEILRPVIKLRSWILLTGFILIAIVGVTGFFQGAAIANPIQKIIIKLYESGERTASASGQISSSSHSLAEGASEQAASIEETSASLEEISSMTKQNAENAQQADNLMQEANEVVSEAGASMTDLTESMEEMTKASEETRKVIKTIDEIAFQTNLLALNAAVEAARAGEAGAGFAVVSEEVRNLALRSAEAAKNTADLIDGTVNRIIKGSELVVTTNEAFKNVDQSTSRMGKLVGQIAVGSNEQSHGINQINTAVAEMDKVIQQNAANAEESASASEELNSQAEQMKLIVGELTEIIGGNRDSSAGRGYGLTNIGTTKTAAVRQTVNKSMSYPEAH